MQYNKKDEKWEGFLIDIKNSIKNTKKQISSEVLDLFSDFNDNGEEFVKARDKILERGTFDEWCDSVKIATDTEKEFLKTWDGAGDISVAFQEHLKKSSQGMTTFEKATKKAGTVLKSFGAALGSMAVNWAIGEVIGLIATAIDNAILTMDEANDALKESVSDFDSVSNEVSDLTKELGECQSRIKELEDLGSLRSIVEDDELSKLQKTNVELTRRLAILKEEKRLDAIKMAKDASNVMTRSIESQYNKTSIGGDLRGKKVKPEEEMRLAIDAYRNYAEEKAKIDDELLKDPENTQLAKESQKWQDKMDLAASRANEMAGYINDVEEAYRMVDEAGGSLTSQQTELFQSSIALGEEYLNFAKEIGTVSDDFEKLDTTEKAQALKDKYAKKTLSLPNGQGTYTIDDREISDWIDTLPDEDLEILGTINFSGEQTKDEMQKALDYAKTHTDLSVDTPEILSISSSIEQLYKQLEPQYSKLGDAYSKIFTENGFTRDNIDNSMLEGLRSTFTDIEKELGITFDTSLLNTFFDSLTDGTQSAEEVQQAFNDLATSYIYSTDVLESLNEETADSVMLQLKQLGVKNAEDVVTAQLTANERKLSAEKELLNKTGKDFATITYGEVNSLKAQNAVTEESVKNITLLAIQKQAASLSTISTSDDIENLYGLIYALSATGVACTKLKTLIDLLNSEEVMPEERKTNIVNSIQEEINAIMKGEGVEIQIDFDGGEASEKAKGTAKDITDMLEKELAVLDRAMEAGYLDFNDYINRRLGLIEDYYNKGKISADQYYSYLQKHYETELSYMDKVTNAVIRRLDKEKQSLEKQKESINERYQKEIDALEKRKSILQEEADNLQRQRDLEKALYDLRRAEEQRTQKIYTADKGFNYVADPEAIRDAQDDVADKKLQIEIAEIDKAIKKLEEARDKEVEAIDQRIEKIEDYKEKWKQISEEFTQKQEDMIAAMVLGADWENDILNQRLDTLENFKDRYIALQQAIVDAAYQAAKAEKDASGATISDTSAGKGDGTSEKDNADKDNTSDYSDKDMPKNNKPKYFVLYKNPNTNQVSKISSFPTKEKAEEEAKRLNDSYYESIYRVEDSDGKGFYVRTKKEAESKAKEYGYRWYEEQRPKKDAYYVQKYHTGLDQGYVSKYRPISDDEKLKMFQKFSRSDLRPDEVPALLKVDELVMTKKQQENILKNLQMTYALNSVPANNNQVVNHVTINCPNVTNNSGAEYLMKELNRLTLDALQYANKRY